MVWECTYLSKYVVVVVRSVGCQSVDVRVAVDHVSVLYKGGRVIDVL